MAATPQPLVTAAQYLEAERKAKDKHEFVDGLVVAMAGASPAHNEIVSAMSGELYPLLKSKGCRSYGSDMRVSSGLGDFFTYPDLTIVCGEPSFDPSAQDTLINPIAIVEVLSPSTEAWDRGEKFARYREIALLQEYVLVSQSQPLAERYVRQGENWVLSVFRGLDATLRLESVDVSVELSAMYALVKFEDATRIPGNP